jgi:hypothetical protein
MRIPHGGLLLLGVLGLLVLAALSLLPPERGGVAMAPSGEDGPESALTSDTLPWPEDPLGFLEGEWSGTGRWPDGSPFSIRSSFRREGPHGYARYEVSDLSTEGRVDILWSGILYRHEGTESLLLMDEGPGSGRPGARQVLSVEVEPGGSLGVVPGRYARVLLFRSGEDEVSSVVEVPGRDEPWVEMARFRHTRLPPSGP